MTGISCTLPKTLVSGFDPKEGQDGGLQTVSSGRKVTLLYFPGQASS